MLVNNNLYTNYKVVAKCASVVAQIVDFKASCVLRGVGGMEVGMFPKAKCYFMLTDACFPAELR